MKRALILSALGVALAAACGQASAHTDLSVMLGVPVAPVYAAPPAVVYEDAPVAYAAPAYAAPAYGYGYGYGYRGDDDWDHRDHDHGRHRGWHKHHHDDDDE
ncbi:hypothetical protein ACFSHT_22960 [Paraburkholderia silviterrae]|uniref:PXPV repeat-containing protein n=1 Tax=Paraburkholderia silviterrae TaxID=2528715 RepID=A0A4R5LXV2_9BURK|nr:hypothetical protein [Paraburkholderia silviterrae]TDG17094.1 hypothetical protein EYW47_39235 [Paraburkholderia silviterrae]